MSKHYFLFILLALFAEKALAGKLSEEQVKAIALKNHPRYVTGIEKDKKYEVHIRTYEDHHVFWSVYIGVFDVTCETVYSPDDCLGSQWPTMHVHSQTGETQLNPYDFSEFKGLKPLYEQLLEYQIQLKYLFARSFEKYEHKYSIHKWCFDPTQPDWKCFKHCGGWFKTLRKAPLHQAERLVDWLNYWDNVTATIDPIMVPEVTQFLENYKVIRRNIEKVWTQILENGAVLTHLKNKNKLP